MKTVLIISSFVSASRVGATVNAFFLHQMGIETVILPTTLFGRHPGWGPPGGTVTDTSYLQDMWAAIAAQNIAFDAVLTGYLGHPDHVGLTTDIISHIKNMKPDTLIVVDPVMGDHGRLYIDPAIAEAIQTKLTPLADIITPNLWEWTYLIQYERDNETDRAKLATYSRQKLSCDCLITSVPVPSSKTPHVGTLYVSDNQGYWVQNPEFPKAPNGSGDALVGSFLGYKLQGASIQDSLSHATAQIYASLDFANAQNRQEFPLAETQDIMGSAQPLDVTPFSF